MRAVRAAVLGVILSGSLLGCAALAPAPSLSQVKTRLVAYKESGAYAREVAEVAAEARRYLARRLGRVQRPAIVLDIDETSLSNWGYIEALDFGYSPGTWSEWVGELSAPALEPTLGLYRFARERGVDVFFISGRSESGRAATEENLRQAGYESWTGIYLRDPADKSSSVVPYKSSARRKIEEQGYTIVVNLGDQQSDMDGGFAERAFKLPNPFYFVP